MFRGEPQTNFMAAARKTIDKRLELSPAGCKIRFELNQN